MRYLLHVTTRSGRLDACHESSVSSPCSRLLSCILTRWKGLPSSYHFEARAPSGAMSFDQCCAGVRSKAKEEAQAAFNVQSELFASALSSQTGVSVSAAPGPVVTGSHTTAGNEIDVYEVDYFDRKWHVTADCDCLHEGFLSIEGGCYPPGIDIPWSFGRKLLDCGFPYGGRRIDTCDMKVQCRFKAVTPDSCPK